MKRTPIVSILALITLCWTAPMWAAETNAPPKPAAVPAPEAVAVESPFDAGKFSVSPFTGWNVSEVETLQGRQFTGVALEYMAVDNVGIEVEGALTDTDERFVDQYGAHLRGYLPLGKKRSFALYGEVGWQRFTRPGSDADAMAAGGGITVRTGHAGVTLGGRWVHDFETVGNAQLFAAFNLTF